MSAEPNPDFSEFAEFGDVLRKQRRLSEKVVRRALNRAKAHYPVPFDELNDVSRALDNALTVVARAIEELRIQNDALFAARSEVEDAYAQFRVAGDADRERWNVKQAVQLSNAHSCRCCVGFEQPSRTLLELHGGDR